MRDTLEMLSREPMVVDDKSISAEAKKKFSDLSKQSEGAEAALMNLVLQRLPIPRDCPAKVSLSELQGLLQNDDVLLSYVHTPGKIYGTAVTKGEQQVWVLPESAPFDAKVALL